MFSMPDWNSDELELVVTDYFDMLVSDLNEDAYEPAEHLQALRELLGGRSGKWIEFKLANISAALGELNMPHLDAYPPAGIVQPVLTRAVQDYVRDNAGPWTPGESIAAAEAADDSDQRATAPVNVVKQAAAPALFRGHHLASTAVAGDPPHDLDVAVDTVPLDGQLLAEILPFREAGGDDIVAPTEAAREDVVAVSATPYAEDPVEAVQSGEPEGDEYEVEEVSPIGGDLPATNAQSNGQADDIDETDGKADEIGEPLANTEPIAFVSTQPDEDAAILRAVEARALDAATIFYESTGWVVTAATPDQPFDLLCTRDDAPELHVAVRGTTGQGQPVFLTPPEVEHARTHKPVDLYLLHGVSADQSDPSSVRVAGGRPELVQDWSPDDERLRPTGFAYIPPERLAS